MTEKVFTQYKNESVADESFLDHALLFRIDPEGEPLEQLVKIDVSIVNGIAHIHVKSNMCDVKSRVIKADWNELQRFWGWFMTMPIVLANREEPGVAGYAIKMKEPVDAYVMDGKIMPAAGKAYVDINQ